MTNKTNLLLINFFIASAIIAAIYFVAKLALDQINYYRSTEKVCVETTTIKRIVPEVSSCGDSGVTYELENGDLYNKDYSGSYDKFTKEGEELCLRKERRYKE